MKKHPYDPAIYDHKFYADRHELTLHAAKSVLSLLLEALPPINSAIDFGCGVGTWLSVLQENGVSEVRGLDGPWVDQSLLRISSGDFRTVNFEEAVPLERRFDLAISLEVAEHISAESAATFVDSLVRASDLILFAAAIPFQGGEGHVNEQWPEYWAKRFAEKDYVGFDFLRKRIWADNRIPFWYRQNIFLFVNEDRVSQLTAALTGDRISMSSCEGLVHPDLYLIKVAEIQALRAGRLRALWRRGKAWLKRVGD